VKFVGEEGAFFGKISMDADFRLCSDGRSVRSRPKNRDIKTLRIQVKIGEADFSQQNLTNTTESGEARHGLGSKPQRIAQIVYPNGICLYGCLQVL
jgi:hypothetical protein